MINRKYSQLLFAMIMGFFMVFIISFVNVIIKNGLNENFIFAWLNSFCIGYPIAIPLIIIIPKWINKLITKITYEKIN
jgi:Protein of unknown function (DUF2798)